MDLNVQLVRFSLLSGLLGFVAFCILQGGNIWWRRNRRIADETPGAASWPAFMASIAVAVGAGIVALSVPLREIVPLEGLLSGKNLFTARVPEEAQTSWVNPVSEVKAGDALVKFRSARLDAEGRGLVDRIAGLKLSRESASLKPLVLDPELVRRAQTNLQDRRQIDSTLQLALPSYANMNREGVHTTRIRREELARVETAIHQVARELEQSRVQRDHWARQSGRQQVLLDKKFSSIIDLEVSRRDSRFYAIEAQKLEQRALDLEQERKTLSESLAKMEGATSGAPAFDKQIQQALVARQELARADVDYVALLAQDRDRAQRVRQLELDEIDARIREAEANLAGVRERQTLTAPFAGSIAFRHGSPQSVTPRGAVLVMSEADGFRLKIKLNAGQVGALKGAGTVEVREIESGFRFPARFTQSRAYGDAELVELACQPYPEIVERLAEGATVQAQLMWRPPLWTTSTFQLGVLLFVAGCLGWIVARFVSGLAGVASSAASVESAAPVNLVSVGPGTAQASPTSCAVAPAGLPTNLDLELGTLGHQLRQLAQRFQESVKSEQIDPESLGAVEWALDRHQTRAIRVINSTLGDLTDLLPQLRRLHGRSDPHAARLFRILAVLQPLVVEELARKHAPTGT